MVTPVQRQWVVLIERAAQGPFNETELRQMIQQGVVRHTSLAYLVSETAGSAGWCFLWQFPEFDRRKDEPPPDPAKPPVFPVARRRMSEQEIRDRIRAEVPEELFQVGAIDLLVRAQPAKPKPRRRGQGGTKVTLQMSFLRSFRLEDLGTPHLPSARVVVWAMLSVIVLGVWQIAREYRRKPAVASHASAAKLQRQPASTTNLPSLELPPGPRLAKAPTGAENRLSIKKFTYEQITEKNIVAPPELYTPQEAAKRFRSPYHDGNPFRIPY